MSSRYVAQLRDRWGMCICDTTDMRSNDRVKARGEATVYTPAIVAAYVKNRELAERICSLLNDEEEVLKGESVRDINAIKTARRRMREKYSANPRKNR